MADGIENWRPVVGWEDAYEVSDLGRVRSVERMVWFTTRWGQRTQRRVPAKIRTLSINQDGHLYLTLHPGRKFWFVHQLVLTAFVGPCPEGLMSCHRNDVKADNRLENLRWDMPTANAQDSVRNGTHRNTRKTHCERGGHEFSPENTYIRPDGKGRDCLECMKEHTRRNGAKNQRAYRARKRARGQWVTQNHAAARNPHSG